MNTVLKLGPGDNGRHLTFDEYLAGEYKEGYRYELIDGKLSVSPLPNLPENCLEDWLFEKLKRYTREHPDVVNYATNKARVFVPGREDATCPEPDISVYSDFPLGRRFRDLSWREVSPALVVEVLSEDDPDKDLVRNVELYALVPSIREYWVLDGRVSTAQPSLHAHRRHGKRWRVRVLGAGETYSTRLLPDFELVLDPER